ncbi:hypothetical protein [Microbulbifer sp. PAAF003]|uniref:hypothetical protein n=1 Tax=Microbulbifer sp. PAAF003 TaxID=3243375 RepID=UPI004039339F
MNKVTATILLIFLSFGSHADSPLPVPKAKRVCNIFVTYCAYLEPAKDTVVYSVEGNFETKEIYKISGWHRSFHISPSGEYVVVGYPGLNLVPKSVTPNQVMLSIYLNGKLQHAITLKQLFHNLESLEPTVSHYQWGSITNVSNYDVRLETVEGIVSVALESGKVYRAPKS